MDGKTPTKATAFKSFLRVISCFMVYLVGID